MKRVNVFLHNFISTTKFSPNDRKETWWGTQRCTHCGIKGRRYFLQENFVYVTDSFSDNRANKCIRDNFIDKYLGKQIQISCKIDCFPFIKIYSIHTVVTPPPEFLNGEQGVWIKVKERKEPIQILFDEYVDYPIKERKRVLFRTKSNKPKVIPPYLRIKHVRTRTVVEKPVRTRTKLPTKRTRTR